MNTRRGFFGGILALAAGLFGLGKTRAKEQDRNNITVSPWGDSELQRGWDIEGIPALSYKVYDGGVVVPFHVTSHSCMPVVKDGVVIGYKHTFLLSGMIPGKSQ